jgi:hypothetical protein
MSELRTFGRISDQFVFRLFREIAEAIGSASSSFQSDRIRFDEQGQQDIETLPKPTFMVTDASIQTEGQIFTITFRRKITKLDRNGHAMFQASPYFDELQIESPNNPHTSIPYATIEHRRKLESILQIYAPVIQSLPNDEETEEAHGLLSKEIAGLADLHHKMVRDLADARRDADKEFSAKRQELDEAKVVSEKLLADRTEAELAEIGQQRADLVEKQKEFDDSNYMFARRQLRERMSDDIKDRVSRSLVPRRSLVASIAIMLLCVGGAMGAGLLAYESLEAFRVAVVPDSRNNAVNQWVIWMLAIRGAVGSAVAIAFVWYLIAWLRRTYNEDVRVSHELQRYALDLNRASWVIETAMEMTTKEGASLPDRWIEGACHGLFQGEISKDADVSSLAALSAVMGMAPEVTVGPTGTTMNFKPSQIRKASNSA